MVNYGASSSAPTRSWRSGARRRCTPSIPMMACPSPTPPWAMWTTGTPRRNRPFWIYRVSPVRRGAKRDPAHRPPHRLRGGVGGERRRVPRRLGRPAGPGALPHPDALHRCAHGVSGSVPDAVPQALPHGVLSGLLRQHGGDWPGTDGGGHEPDLSSGERGAKNLLRPRSMRSISSSPLRGYPGTSTPPLGERGLEALYTQVEAEDVGGTDIYYAAMEGLRQLDENDLGQYTCASSC